MFLVDSALFFLIVVALHFYKFKHLNFLFFCKGAILFLPPDEDTPVIGKQKNNKSKKQQPQIKILQIEYKHVRDFPMSIQYDRIIFMLASLVIYLPLKWVIYQLADMVTGTVGAIPSSSFTYIICMVVLVYSLKIGLQIFWISSYSIKICIMIAVGINVLLMLMFLGMRNVGTYDTYLEEVLLDYGKQIGIVVGRQTGNNLKVVNILAFVFFVNVLFVLVGIPSVIKFGNWYTKTLKQMHYQDEQIGQITNEQQKKQLLKKQAMLKQKSKSTIRFLNIYLVSMLAFLFFSHRYILNYLPELAITIVRIILMGVMTFVNCHTLKQAIEFNGSFAYKFIGMFLNSSDPKQRAQLRRRVRPYLDYIWYHKFQFMFRIIIPLVLFIMVLDWKYMHNDDIPLSHVPTLSHTNCALATNKLQILQNLYKCPSTSPTTLIHSISEATINGALIAGRKNEQMVSTQQRVIQYGLLSPQFMTEFSEQILWYQGVVNFGMTVVYVLFLRKTVYDI